MIFDLNEYDDFRAEIAAWCADRWPGGVATKFFADGPRGDDWAAEYRKTMKGLGDQGWLCGGWPVQYGGGGWRIMKQAVFNEAAAYHRIPGTGLSNGGTSIIGPTIMIYGTEEQKQRYLPGIAHGELRCGLGFSEPNAGSDLAGLQTRAVADGDDFIINGAKIWNHSTDSDLMLLLTRTNADVPKHKGITQFLLPLKTTPGITIQAIDDLTDNERWTLLTMEDVRLPRSAVLGEIDKGWYQQKTSLDLERAQMGWIGESRRLIEELVDTAKTTFRNGKPLIKDTFIRDLLGDLAVQLEVARWTTFRAAYLQDMGLIPNAEASMSKLHSSEVQQRIQRAGLVILGPAAHQRSQQHYGPDNGRWDWEYWDGTGTTIAGGTSEVQRNIIATRGLGLPR